MIKKLFFLFLFVTALIAHAESCNEFSVSFMVAGVEKWNGLSPLEIQKQELAANTPSDKQVVMLKELIAPYAKQGTLIINACGGKSKSFEVSDLLSDAAEKSDLALTLSKKNFFKLVNINNSKPILKKVYQLKLVP